MQILNSTPADLDIIFKLYNAAIKYQLKVSPQQWKGFERSLIETEIGEKRNWKIMVAGEVACIFSITFNDRQIWGEKDLDDAVYIHRIVTNPAFRGSAFVKTIIEWAKQYVVGINRHYVRMDTWADNQKLLGYYTSCGFNHVGQVNISASKGLPKHYAGISLNLFQLAAQA